MSLRYEQHASLLRTHNFLHYLLTHRGRITKKELRETASSCLRHFPHLSETGKPMFSQDEFTKD